MEVDIVFKDLNERQINVLIASILGDGELTKLYKNSRRKNSSYREHYGENQKEYREWKAQFMNGLLYITPKSHSLRSASNPLFTNLFKLFYYDGRQKTIPYSLLRYCKHALFLAILYMDDGSLSISHRINHNLKKIYLLPHIYLYLQCYTSKDLTVLKNHIKEIFDIELHLASRMDGYGTILKTTSVKESFCFLNTIIEVVQGCPSMFYKTNWDYRLPQETKKWSTIYPEYEIVVSSSNRWKNYTDGEINKLVFLKKSGLTDKEIATLLGRSYWSVVNKLSELRKEKFINFS
jgi:hypothetical protein